MKLIDGYYAKNQNGGVYWHKEMPEKGVTIWADNNAHIGVICIQIDGPWEDSLHRVEDGKITKVQTYSKDQKVLVSDDGENCQDRRWYRRYYSHYKDGNHYVFSNGKTSWSQEGKSVFKYIKPAEEE
jgi:hypothetical protein